jgi:predicted nucleic acid-binding protein
MIVLADTSVWIDHLRRENSTFADLLRRRIVLMHPFVLGELALGNLTSRGSVLADLGRLRVAGSADHQEVMGLVERRELWGRGLGWIDAHLVASALLNRARLWSLDKVLADVAADLGIALS